MKWFKWHTAWLQSTIRDQLYPAERATFHDMVCLAALNDDSLGHFKIASWESLARKLNTPLEVILSTKDKCLNDRISISQNEASEIIVSIINWAYYQAPIIASKSLANPQKTLAKLEHREEENREEENRIKQNRVEDAPPSPPAAASFDSLFSKNGLREELQTKFPSLNLDSELTKCALWWTSSKRKLKSPELAFRNWLEKAHAIAESSERKIPQKERGGKGMKDDPDKFIKGKYGHIVKR